MADIKQPIDTLAWTIGRDMAKMRADMLGLANMLARVLDDNADTGLGNDLHPTPLPNLTISLLDYLSDTSATTDSIATDDEKYIDILLTDNDLTLDAAGCVVTVSGRASIAQDIGDMLKDTGLLVSLIGQRDKETRQLHFNRIEREIEDDLRIVPGTARITETDQQTYWITAKTLDYQDIGFYL